MHTYIPYTYLIGWSKLNLWYYGVEYGWRSKTANPCNLWKSYFTSSKKVKLIRETHGEPDIIQIRKTFKDAFSAKTWEEKVLRRMHVSNNEKWLNVFADTFKGITDVDYEKAVKNWKKSFDSERASNRMQKLWKDPDFSEKMIEYRKSPERKIVVSKQMVSLRKSDPVIFCEKCNKYIKGKGNWKRHLNGISHKGNLNNEKIHNNFICLSVDSM
jgi:hypothetical protein